jgi:hypothetical protein
MQRDEAIALEARLSQNRVAPRQIGIIYLTDEDNHTTMVEAFYSAEDVLRLLDSGMSVRGIVTALGGVKIHG